MIFLFFFNFTPKDDLIWLQFGCQIIIMLWVQTSVTIFLLRSNFTPQDDLIYLHVLNYYKLSYLTQRLKFDITRWMSRVRTLVPMIIFYFIFAPQDDQINHIPHCITGSNLNCNVNIFPHFYPQNDQINHIPCMVKLCQTQPLDLMVGV